MPPETSAGINTLRQICDVLIRAAVFYNSPLCVFLSLIGLDYGVGPVFTGKSLN
jgi:hypothetical protein